MSNIYVVFPEDGYGSSDMVIVADNEQEAAEMFYEESKMNGQYYEGARENGCKVAPLDKTKGVKYVRQDNL